MSADGRDRVVTREFLSRVAARSGESEQCVSEVYDALLEVLMEAVRAEETVVLFGFGRFYRQFHKGHKAGFGREDVDDYVVLKFSASRILNRWLEADPADLEDARVSLPPGVLRLNQTSEPVDEELELEAVS